MKLILFNICLFYFIGFTFLNAQLPHLSGEIQISIKNGTIDCNLDISNLPKVKDYAFWLNTGFNIQYLRDSSDQMNYGFQRFYDNSTSFEAFQYFLPDDTGEEKFLPNRLKFKYVGAFPVIEDTLRAYNRGDWKGNIAFNGISVRASEQTAWYPVLYDIENDIPYHKMTFDVTVKCNDCETIYMNGVPPQRKKTAHFKSDLAVPLMLYAGDFAFDKSGETYFVNTGLSEKQQAVLSGWTDRITSFYEAHLNIPYGSSVSFVGATPVTKNNAWMFVTYPTIAVVGRGKWGINGLFDDKTGVLKDTSSIAFIAHELGHYYFGSKIVPNDELRWVFLEGLTDYPSLQAYRALAGEDFYDKKINQYLESIEKQELFTPLSQVKGSEISEIYRYRYVPLLLSAVEKEIGQKQMLKWLTTILQNSNGVNTNYDFFKSSIIKSGVSQADWERLEEKYFSEPNSVHIISNRIKQ